MGRAIDDTEETLVEERKKKRDLEKKVEILEDWKKARESKL